MADPILVTDQQGTTNAKPILVTGIGGGGGGTTNYNQLSNKPRINNVELSGNKTLSQLKITMQEMYDESADNTKLTSGSDINTISPTESKIVNGNDSVSIIKTQVEVKNGTDVSTIKKNEIKTTDGTNTNTSIPTQVEVKSGNDVATVKKNEIKITDGTDTNTATPLKVEIKDADETTTIKKNEIKVDNTTTVDTTTITPLKVEVKDADDTVTLKKNEIEIKNTTDNESMVVKYDTTNKATVSMTDEFLIKWQKALGIENLAVIEKSTVSKAYEIGTYLIYKEKLYRVTKAIANGGSIVTTGTNANVQAIRIDEIIKELNDKDDEQQIEINYNANNGVKNILDTSNALKENSVIGSVNSDGSLTWKSVGVSVTYIGKAELKKDVIYKISSDIVLSYGRVAISSSPDSISSQAGGNAPDITMLSGATHWIYAIRATGQIKESTFKANSDQTVYLWTGGDGTFTAPQTTKIMIKELNIGDDTYIPYAQDNSILTQNTTNSNIITNNQKNLIRMGALAQEINGITFTRNADGSVTVSGVATGNAFYNLGNNGANKLTIKAGTTYKLSNNTELPTGMALVMRKTAATTTLLTVVAGSKEGTYTPTADDTVFTYIQVYVGTDFTTPVTIYPMLRDARITDDSYVPPFDSGWCVLQTGILYRKTNGIVYINVSIPQAAIQEQAASGWKALNADNVLPPGFRPSSDNSIVPRNPVAFRKVADNKFAFTMGQVNGAGQIQYSSETIGTVNNTDYNIIDFDICYPVD